MPKVQYVCETCGKAYADQDVAVKCEESHPDVVEVVSKEYDLKGYFGPQCPDRICIRMSTGRVFKYSISDEVDC